MTFDEWLEDYELTRGMKFGGHMRVHMRKTWEAALEASRAAAFRRRPADDDGCKPFDSQAEIAKLRGGLKEIRSILEMLQSPPHVVPAGLSDRIYDTKTSRPGDVNWNAPVSNEIEPEVAAGEGFGGSKVTDFHNWRNSKESKPADWAIDGLPEDHPERTKRVNERSAQAFQDRYEQLKADGMDAIDAFKQALDERHGRKPAEPNFPGY